MKPLRYLIVIVALATILSLALHIQSDRDAEWVLDPVTNDPQHKGVPASWDTISAMVGDNENGALLYAVPDSVDKGPRIYTIDVEVNPARIVHVMVLSGGPSHCPIDCDYDPEGIAQTLDGSFWIASEGKKSERANLLIRIDKQGHILQEVTLPASVQALKKKQGFEGVALTDNGDLLVAFQREWRADPAGQVRIGRYTPSTDDWRFYYYPLDAVESPAGGWVGLSEITALGRDRFAVIERDNQGGPNARVKRIYTFSLEGLTPAAQGGSFPLLSKTLVRDILPDLRSPKGWVPEKPEGLAVSADGEVYMVSDNDGADEPTRETRFLHLGNTQALFKTESTRSELRRPDSSD